MSWTGGWELFSPYPVEMSSHCGTLYMGSVLWASNGDEVWKLSGGEWVKTADSGFTRFFEQGGYLFGVNANWGGLSIYRTLDGITWTLRYYVDHWDMAVDLETVDNPGWILVERRSRVATTEWRMYLYDDSDGGSLSSTGSTDFYPSGDVWASSFVSADGIHILFNKDGSTPRLYRSDPSTGQWTLISYGMPTWFGGMGAGWHDGNNSYAVGRPGMVYNLDSREWMPIAPLPFGEGTGAQAAAGGYVGGDSGVWKYNPTGDHSLVLPKRNYNAVFFRGLCWGNPQYTTKQLTNLWHDDYNWEAADSCTDCDSMYMSPTPTPTPVPTPTPTPTVPTPTPTPTPI